MSAAEVLQMAEGAGLALMVVDQGVAINPRDRLTDEIRGAIREHKVELIALLSTKRSDYWLIDGAILLTTSPPMTFAEVQAQYAGRTVSSLSEELWQTFPHELTVKSAP